MIFTPKLYLFDNFYAIDKLAELCKTVDKLINREKMKKISLILELEPVESRDDVVEFFYLRFLTENEDEKLILRFDKNLENVEQCWVLDPAIRKKEEVNQIVGGDLSSGVWFSFKAFRRKARRPT